jgi:hypothetical protein
MKKILSLLLCTLFSLSAMDKPQEMPTVLKIFNFDKPFNNLSVDLKNIVAPCAPAGGWWYPDIKLKYEHRSVIADRYAERVRFSPSGKKIVTSPNRGKKCSTSGISVNDIWDEQGNLLYTFKNPWQCGLATDWFNEQENKFFVANGWGCIETYDFEEKKLRDLRGMRVRHGWGGLEKIVWTPDCSKVACLTTWDLCEIDAASGNETIISESNLKAVCGMRFCKGETNYIFDYKVMPKLGRYVTRNNVLFCFYRPTLDADYLSCMICDRNGIERGHVVMKQKKALEREEDLPKVSTTGAKIAFKSSYFVPSNLQKSAELQPKNGCILYNVKDGTSQELPIEYSPSTIQFNHDDTLMFLCMDHGIEVWDIREIPFLHATIPSTYQTPRVACDKQGDKFIVSENDIYVWSKYKPTFKQLQFKLLLNGWWQTAKTSENCCSPQALCAAIAKRFSEEKENLVLAQNFFEAWQTFNSNEHQLEEVVMPNEERVGMSRMQAAMWRTVQNKINRSKKYPSYSAHVSFHAQ